MAATLDNYEPPRSIEPLGQRALMLNVMVVLWLLLAGQALISGSLHDSPISDLEWAGRIVGCAVGLTVAVSAMTWIRRLDDRLTYRIANTLVVVAALWELLLSSYGPGAIAGMYVAYVAIAIFVGQFLSFREVVAQMVLITVLSAIGVAAYYGDPNAPHILTRIVALVPLLWAVAISVYALRRDRTLAIEEVERKALSDPLTGLVNLRALRRHAEALLARRNQRINRPLGVLVIDLDGFRTTNVLHGHAEGDRMLRAIADALADAAETTHTVARTGSDEFMVLVENATQDRLLDLAASYRRTVLAAVEADPLRSTGIDASVGVALSGGLNDSFDDLVGIADRAMHAVKAEHSRKPMITTPKPPGLDGQRFDSDLAQVASRDAPAGVELASSHRLSWRRRSKQIQFVTAAWATMTLAIGVSLLMPDAVVTNGGAVVALLGFALVMAALRYVSSPSRSGWQQAIDVLVALSAISLMTYWTGGAASPAWPASLLVLVYVGWFMDLRWIPPLLVISVAAILLPLTYNSATPFRTVEAVGLFGGVTVSLALMAIMAYNHFYLIRARTLSEQLSSIDPRTGINNRREFERRLSDEINKLGYADSESLAVAMLDLGGFREVTVKYGRATANKLLTEVAKSIQESSRANDCVARLGGDEFAVLLPGVDADEARMLAQRFVRAVTLRFKVGDLPAAANINPSAGFSLYGMHGRTNEELITAADVALTAAKTSNRGGDHVSSFVVAL